MNALDLARLTCVKACESQGAHSERRPFPDRFCAIALLLLFSQVLATTAVDGQVALDDFDPNANGTIRAIAVQPNGSVLLGGDFTAIGGQPRNYIARVNADGTLDNIFNPNANGAIYAIAVQADGRVLLGGRFTEVGGQMRGHIARVERETGEADSFDPGIDPPVYYNVQTIVTQSDEKIIVGGYFSIMGRQQRGSLARLNAPTGLADSFRADTGAVNAVAVQVDGKILVAGSFGAIGGQPRSYMARLDPTTGIPDSFDPNANNDVFAIAVQGDGKILASGAFSSIGGQPRHYIARLDSATGLADPFNPDPNHWVLAMAVQSDGGVLAGGWFNNIGGQSRYHIARLDSVTGLADPYFDANASSRVYAVAIQDDGKILVGGDFTLIVGTERNRIARLTPLATPTPGGTPLPTPSPWPPSPSSTPCACTPTPAPTASPTPTPTNTPPPTVCHLNQGFDDISNLVVPDGWITRNNSEPIGRTQWFQGNTLVFAARSGSANSYIAANYQNAANLATISNWLLTAPILLENGSQLSFWTRTVGSAQYPDRLQVRMSVNGTSVNVGNTATSVGDFSTLLLDINPVYDPDGYPNTWTNYVVTLSGITSPVKGRLAFRYFAENGGPLGSNSDYIGIDDVQFECDAGGPTPTPTTSPTPTPSVTPSPIPMTFLGNISTRLRVEAGDNALIGGFIVAGTQAKKVLVRAIGPSLGVSGALADPMLELRDSAGALIRSNDNWRSDQQAEIIATGIPPGNDSESAIVATLPADGSACTAIVRGADDGTGVGLVEVYDLDQTVDSKLANISTRGLVQTGNDVMIAGTIVLGEGLERVLVRAIGPSLPVTGALSDPTLELRDSNGTLLHTNDNWRSDQETEIMATSIPPTNDAESAIIATLPAGGAAYTAIVRGVNDSTGVALVEIYALTN